MRRAPTGWVARPPSVMATRASVRCSTPMWLSCRALASRQERSRLFLARGVNGMCPAGCASAACGTATARLALPRRRSSWAGEPFRHAGRRRRHAPGMACVKAPGPKTSSIRARTASRSIPMEASAFWSAALNNSALGPRPTKRTISVVTASGVTQCSRKTALAGSRSKRWRATDAHTRYSGARARAHGLGPGSGRRGQCR